MRMGIDIIAKYASGMGLGHKTGIDLPSEEAGLMPSEEWVQRVFHRRWYPGETVSVASDRVLSPPRPCNWLASSVASPPAASSCSRTCSKTRRPSPKKHSRSRSPPSRKSPTICMASSTPAALARDSSCRGIEFSGKSGTAQVIGYAARDRVAKQKKFLDNAWFVGYAPKRDPEIVVSVLVQESGKHGGEASGPVVRDIIKAYYDKKAKKTQGQYTVEYKRYDLGNGSAPAAAIQPQPVLKPEGPTEAAPARASVPQH